MQSCGLPVKQNFLKKLALRRAPACLCIHFNRNTWLPQGLLHKNSLHISFPVKLNAGQLLSRGEPVAGLQYLLCAVVEHIGGASSGHYLTYRRCGSRGKQWVCASDTTVYSVTINQVLNAEAYMLFYNSSPQHWAYVQIDWCIYCSCLIFCIHLGSVVRFWGLLQTLVLAVLQLPLLQEKGGCRSWAWK